MISPKLNVVRETFLFDISQIDELLACFEEKPFLITDFKFNQTNPIDRLVTFAVASRRSPGFSGHGISSFFPVQIDDLRTLEELSGYK